MKLTHRRFWKFEAMMLLCGVLLFCLLCSALICNGAEIDSGSGIILILLFPIFLLYFAICGIPTWLLYNGGSWMKLAGYLYFISSLLVIAPIMTFMYDWNPATANMRPENIPIDEGTFFTDNEFAVIICVGWAMSLIIPVVFTSYLSKRWIIKDNQGHGWIVDSASRAIQGNLQSNVRAIAIGYRYNRLTLKCYLDSFPSEQDKELLSDIAGEIISDCPPDKIPRTTEICEFSNVPISELDKLDSFIYIRTNEL
ncbi:hypothetical protein E4T81_05275 [Barnesiella sp. WM24]|uniref:hypothetical protein n=1 Tax=Barnesiella sp. WM24 TaxID=2558278 RepID=UPI001071A546|nr:hypothetical protein [Barnesiella sp. WM24]TFU94004.1 hypothetical protein E4T81_05275 [Barnesiella sp. WM24]